jgi:hypothetical protein
MKSAAQSTALSEEEKREQDEKLERNVNCHSAIRKKDNYFLM